jgi:Domain of unknown function (DUF4159)
MFVPTALPPSTEEGLRRRSDRLLANCFLVSLALHLALGALLASLRWSQPVSPPRFTEVRLIRRVPSVPLRPGRRPQPVHVVMQPKDLSLYLHNGTPAPPRRRARRGRRSRRARPAPMLASRPVESAGDLGAGGDGANAPEAGPFAASGRTATAPPLPGGERPGRRGRARHTGDGSARPRARRIARLAHARRDTPSNRERSTAPRVAAAPAPIRSASVPAVPQPIRMARRASPRGDESLPARADTEPDVPILPARRPETEPVAHRTAPPAGDRQVARLPERLPSVDAGPPVLTGPDTAKESVTDVPSPVRVRAEREERREPDLDPRISSGRGTAADEALPGPGLATTAPDERPGARDAFPERRGARQQGRSTAAGAARVRSKDGHVPDLSGDDTRDAGPAGRGDAGSAPGGAPARSERRGDAAAKRDAEDGAEEGGPQRFGRRSGGRGGGDGVEGKGDRGDGPGTAKRGSGSGGDDDAEGDLGLPGGGGRGEGDGGPGGESGGPGGAGGRGLPAKPDAGGVYVSTTGRYTLPGAVTGSDYMFHVNALTKILDEINSRTRLRVRLGRQYLRIRPGGFQRAPVVVFTGHRAFALNDEQRLALRQYVEGGGMIWADLANAPFDDSFRDEMERIFGHRPAPLSPGHTIYRSFYVLDGVPPGDLGSTAPFEGIAVGDRLAVVITPNRYFGAVTGPPHVTEAVQEGAFRVAVNIYVYAAAHYRAGQDD